MMEKLPPLSPSCAAGCTEGSGSSSAAEGPNSAGNPRSRELKRAISVTSSPSTEFPPCDVDPYMEGSLGTRRAAMMACTRSAVSLPRRLPCVMKRPARADPQPESMERPQDDDDHAGDAQPAPLKLTRLPLGGARPAAALGLTQAPEDVPKAGRVRSSYMWHASERCTSAISTFGLSCVSSRRSGSEGRGHRNASKIGPPRTACQISDPYAWHS